MEGEGKEKSEVEVVDYPSGPVSKTREELESHVSAFNGCLNNDQLWKTNTIRECFAYEPLELEKAWFMRLWNMG